MPRPLARVTPLAVVAMLVAATTAGCGEQRAPSEGASPATDSSRESPTGATDTGPGTDDGRTLTPADDGTVLHLRVGDVVELHLPDGSAPEPRATGDAIEVVETVDVAPTRGREWEIRAVRAGEARLTGSSDGGAFGFRFRVRG